MTFIETDSRYAAMALAEEIKWATGVGPSQLSHFYRNLTEEFGSKAYVGALTAVKDDILSKYAALEAAGIVDRHNDVDVPISVVTLAEGRGLSVRFADGGNLLLAWTENEKADIELAVFPWRDNASSALVDEIKRAATSAPTHAELADIAGRAAQYSGLGLEDEHLLYSGLPLSIGDLTDFITDIGLSGTAGGASIGEYKGRGRTYGGEVFILTATGSAHHPGVIDCVEKLVKAFTPRREIPGYHEKTVHLTALLDGKLAELYNSACALSMEFNLKAGLATISEIIASSEKLALSSELAYAYGDEDLVVYCERRDGRELYMHNNVDLNEGCAYATVLSYDADGYTSCDVYLARRWACGFEHYFGPDLSAAANERLAGSFLRYAVRGGDTGWIPEDRLVAALDDDVLPTLGLVFSYDLRTASMAIDSDLARGTGYLYYFRLMTDGDRKALSDALNGEGMGWGEVFLSRSIADGAKGKATKIETGDYLAELATSTEVKHSAPRR